MGSEQPKKRKNIRAKGQTGEREVADMLNMLIYLAADELDFPEEEKLKAFSVVQRNQNQSAVGGNDLTNCFGLSIEVKRQEALAVNTWWKQCQAAAERNNETPVLMYRQNNRGWKVMTYVWVSLPGNRHMLVEATMEIDHFKKWFQEWVKQKLLDGEPMRN